MTRVTFYRTCAILFMTSLALCMKCISNRWKVFISGFFMALAAVVGIIIVNVMMAVQTFQTIGVCVRKVGE